ncbi:MAG: plasmid mobilization relaxosome protein MobC [Gammaproteobacteria bacterium]|nr:plasmid mobilization relaxosome protein MobC [Gammaproteobacteria bacterium]
MQIPEQMKVQNQVVSYEKPTSHVGLRLPPSIALHWKTAAKAQGKTLSDWLRAQVHDLEIRMAETNKKPRNKREVCKTYQNVDPLLIRELVRIGVNLNQVSRQANRAALMGKTIQVVSFLLVLVDMQNELRDVLNSLNSNNQKVAVNQPKESTNAH